MDAPPFCPAAGFSEPVAAITRRENRRFDVALAVVFGLAVGVLLVAVPTLTHPAPETRCASTAMER